MTAVATSVKRALTTYGTPAFTEIIKNGMAQDLSWKVGGGGVKPLNSVSSITSLKILSPKEDMLSCKSCCIGAGTC